MIAAVDDPPRSPQGPQRLSLSLSLSGASMEAAPLMTARSPRADDVVGGAVAETAVRRDLAAAYRLVALFGMDDGIYTHISARIPARHDQFLINRFGMLFRDVTASSLVKVGLDGEVVASAASSAAPSATLSAAGASDVNPAGFTIHSAIHAARPDAACVLHTHTVAGVAVASLAAGLQPCNQWALQFHDRVRYHDYEGIALDHDERERLVADLGPTARVLILRNHGLLTVGRTVAEAFILMHNLERACRVQVAIQGSGQPVHVVPEAVCERTARQYESGDSNRVAGQPDPHHREWQALLSRLGPAPTTSYLE